MLNRQLPEGILSNKMKDEISEQQRFKIGGICFMDLSINYTICEYFFRIISAVVGSMCAILVYIQGKDKEHF